MFRFRAAELSLLAGSLVARAAKVFNLCAVALTVAIVAVGAVLARSGVFVAFPVARLFEHMLAAIAMVMTRVIAESLDLPRVKMASAKAQLVGALVACEGVTAAQRMQRASPVSVTIRVAPMDPPPAADPEVYRRTCCCRILRAASFRSPCAGPAP